MCERDHNLFRYNNDHIEEGWATRPDATNNYLTLTPTADYTSAGQLKHFAYGNGVVADFGYNDHFETTSIRYSKSGSADLLNLAYSYGTQNNGEISTITDNVDATRSMTYTYDAWSRLSTSQAGPNATPTWKYSYDYDRFGNRKNQNFLAGTAMGSNTLLTIDPATNHITGTGNTYDAAGNMTGDSLHTYAFDAENRIKTVDATAATYTYNATNLRVKKVVGSTTTVYVYSGSSLIAEYAGGTVATSPSKEYIGGGGSALASVSAGAVTYYHADMLSTRAESNGTGGVTRTYGHLPFGEDWYETGSDKWKFTSYERDAESQLNYAMNRFDSGRYGRFMSMDPLAGSAGVPQSLNRYAYAGNDPVNYSDPMGLMKTADCRIMMMSCGGGFDGSGVFVDGVELPNFSGLGGDLVEFGAATDVTTQVTTTYENVTDLTEEVSHYIYDDQGNLLQSSDSVNSKVTVTDTDVVTYLPSFTIGGGASNFPTIGAGEGGEKRGSKKAWYKNPCITDALGDAALHVGIDAIGLIPEAGGIARIIGHGPGYRGIVATQYGTRAIIQGKGAVGAISGAFGLGDTSPEGLLSTGLTVAGFIPVLGQAASIGSILLDTYKAAKAIGQCH